MLSSHPIIFTQIRGGILCDWLSVVKVLVWMKKKRYNIHLWSDKRNKRKFWISTLFIFYTSLTNSTTTQHKEACKYHDTRFSKFWAPPPKISKINIASYPPFHSGQKSRCTVPKINQSIDMDKPMSKILTKL